MHVNISFSRNPVELSIVKIMCTICSILGFRTLYVQINQRYSKNTECNERKSLKYVKYKLQIRVCNKHYHQFLF